MWISSQASPLEIIQVRRMFNELMRQAVVESRVGGPVRLLNVPAVASVISGPKGEILSNRLKWKRVSQGL